MISAESRYAASPTWRVIVDEDGNRRLTVYGPNSYPMGFRYQQYRVKEGDRIDLIANQFYGEPRHWWLIATVNPLESWWGDLEPNTILRIPIAG